MWVGDHFTLYSIIDQRVSPPFHNIYISVFQFYIFIMDFFDLFQIISTLQNCLNFCRESGTSKRSFMCPQCDIQMTLLVDNSKIDSYIFRCKLCKKKTSIRNKYFFSQTKLSIKEILLFVYCWVYKMPMHSIKCVKLGSLSLSTLVDWGCILKRDKN